MSDPSRIQIRCSEETARRFKAAAKRHGMTLGEFAENVAKFADERDDDFERFVYKEDRKRPERD